MFNDEEIAAAKATRDALRNGDIPEGLKSIYMAGEICMWDELGRPLNPKEPETVHGNEAEKEVCNHVYVVDGSISVTQMKCCKCGNMKPISFT